MTVGGKVKTTQWADFYYDMDGRQILFRVTSYIGRDESLEDNAAFVLTHSASGMRVTDVTFRDIAFTRYNAGRNNYGAAGARALKRKIDSVGLAAVIKAIRNYPAE